MHMTRPNYKQITYGVYVVRTQAGFKQALKHFDAYSHVEGFPTSYPSVVFISDNYHGYHYTEVKCIHVNKMRDMLEGE